jgi:hypothetical protein
MPIIPGVTLQMIKKQMMVKTLTHHQIMKMIASKGKQGKKEKSTDCRGSIDSGRMEASTREEAHQV